MGGTEAFPDLGRHCQNPECNQLDFLPFKCHACRKVFCLEHRSYKSHDCPNSYGDSRRVVICEVCSLSIEVTGYSEVREKEMLERHDRSGKCDPRKKNKPKCPVRRCKELLTFSNNTTCKICELKVCLKHRFPADHACKSSLQSPEAADRGGSVNKFLIAMAAREAKDCAKEERCSSSPPSIHSTVNLCPDIAL